MIRLAILSNSYVVGGPDRNSRLHSVDATPVCRCCNIRNRRFSPESDKMVVMVSWGADLGISMMEQRWPNICLEQINVCNRRKCKNEFEEHGGHYRRIVNTEWHCCGWLKMVANLNKKEVTNLDPVNLLLAGMKIIIPTTVRRHGWWIF